MFVVGSNGEEIVQQAILTIAVSTTMFLWCQAALQDPPWTVADIIKLLQVILCLYYQIH